MQPARLKVVTMTTPPSTQTVKLLRDQCVGWVNERLEWRKKSRPPKKKKKWMELGSKDRTTTWVMTCLPTPCCQRKAPGDESSVPWRTVPHLPAPETCHSRPLFHQSVHFRSVQIGMFFFRFFFAFQSANVDGTENNRSVLSCFLLPLWWGS